MPERIVDEFSHLPVSHQRKTQLRNKRDEKCIICGKPRVTNLFCLKHARADRDNRRKRRGVKKHYRTLLDRLGQEIVNDEFTHLDLPHSKKMEMRYKRDGKCVICGDSLATKRLCIKHAEKHRKAARKRKLAR